MRTSEYLTFTKKERNGIIALLILLLGVIILSRMRKRDPDFVSVTLSADTTADTIVKQAANNEPGIPQQFSLHHRPAPAGNHAKRKISAIDINTADTSAFIALPGIGSKLASRIVAFREKLGGFYDVNQVGEVYGLKDSVFRKLLPSLKCDTGKVRKININTADKEMLKMHPYIRWKIADIITTYRDEHGAFKSRSDLERMENIDTESLTKIMPYLSFH